MCLLVCMQVYLFVCLSVCFGIAVFISLFLINRFPVKLFKQLFICLIIEWFIDYFYCIYFFLIFLSGGTNIEGICKRTANYDFTSIESAILYDSLYREIKDPNFIQLSVPYSNLTEANQSVFFSHLMFLLSEIIIHM